MHPCWLVFVLLQKEGVYIAKLNMILVQVSVISGISGVMILWAWRAHGFIVVDVFLFVCRFWSRSGRSTGPRSSVTLWERVAPARACVRTTWSSWSSSVRRCLTSPVARWHKWKPNTWRTGTMALKENNCCIVWLRMRPYSHYFFLLINPYCFVIWFLQHVQWVLPDIPVVPVCDGKCCFHFVSHIR